MQSYLNLGVTAFLGQFRGVSLIQCDCEMYNMIIEPGVYKFHNSPPPGGGNEIQPKKFGERNSREKRRKRRKERKKRGKEKKRKRKGKKKNEGKKKKEGRKKKEGGRKKKEGKKKVKIGEETLLKFAGVSFGKFKKI